MDAIAWTGLTVATRDFFAYGPQRSSILDDPMLDLASLLVFAGVLFVAAASPGPAVAAIVARVLGKGVDGALAFVAGIAVGDVVWLSLAIAGLAVIAHSFAVVFLVIKYAGAAYLLYLAWKLWTSPVKAQSVEANTVREKPVKLFLAGLALTMGNPKVMVFYLALLPNIIDLEAVKLLGFVELAAVVLGVLALVLGSYVVLAARARALFASPAAMKRINRASGGVMAGAAVWIAAR
jgi:threonine/homoserine/homoserine lactone efflux protein